MEALIPARYQNFNFCNIEENVTTFGIFDLVINDTELRGLLIPNIITLTPTEISTVTIEDKSYVSCIFHKGDTFMKGRTLVKNKFLIIRMFKEFVGFANLPRFVTYENCHLLFSNINGMAEMNLHLDTVTEELIWAFLYRLTDDLRIQARYGTKEQAKEFIGLRNVTYGPDSTSAKIFGSYMSDGLNSALVNPNESNKPLEDIMRL